MDIVRTARERGLMLVRFLWCGNDGTVRAKATALGGLEARLNSGIGVTLAMEAMNSLDRLQSVEGMGPVGELRIVPDPTTFRVLPYAPRTGAVLTDQVGLDGNPAPVCQRSFLKRMEAALDARGALLRAGFENEFTLARLEEGKWRPVDSSLCFSTIGMTASQEYVDALVEALEQQGIVGRPVLRRARARSTGADHRTRSGAARGRHADPDPRDDPRCRRLARARRVARSQAVA